MTLTNITGTNHGAKTLVRVRPRGFCAGVVRAVDIVELALEAYGRAGLRASRDRAQPLRGGPVAAPRRDFRRDD